MSHRELLGALRRAYLRFYLQPDVLVHHLRKFTTPAIARNYLRSARIIFLP